MTEARPFADWTQISAQNRWQGVIFSGNPDARIVPQVRARNDLVVMNAHWTVQSRGSLVTQMLKTNKRETAHHQVGGLMWFAIAIKKPTYLTRHSPLL
jgi:hypothetical protein